MFRAAATPERRRMAAGAFAIAAALTTVLAPRSVVADDFLTATGGNLRHGYVPNANLDPNIVGSNAFGQLYQASLPTINGVAPGHCYASPLVYTLPSTGKQAVFVATTNNNIYTLDAGTGAVLNAANVDVPFNVGTDVNCGDINNANVGVIGTPAIDPATGVAYFFSKTYAAGTGPGMFPGGAPLNGRYHFHGVRVDGLQEMNGYPVDLEGIVADNDKRRVFQGGIVLQRPAVMFQNGVVYAAFGSHCDLFNFTGWVMSFEASTGTLISAVVTNSGATTNINNGGSGIWMSGGGVASDSSNRLFVVTGNGDDSPTKVATAGNSPPGQLGQSTINFGIDASGKMHAQDFFMPYNYQQLNGGDRDFGSGGVTLFPQGTVFSTPSHPKLCASVGKTGLVYVMDANNLGGFAQGAQGGDGVLATVTLPGSMFGSVAMYPGVEDGGFMYAIPAGSPLQAYRFSSSGDTVGFSFAGQAKNNARQFSGSPIVTSMNGAPGSAIVWYMDYSSSIYAFKAVPQNGDLAPLFSASVAGIYAFNKFTRPAFSQGSVYIVTSDGRMIKYGSPLTTPLTAQSVDFGKVVVGFNTSVQPVNFVVGANAVTVTGVKISDPSWTLTTPINFPIQLQAKAPFPISLTFNPTAPGSYNAVLNLTVTANGISLYALASLHGAALANGANLVLQPNSIDFGGVVTGLTSNTATAIVLNDGSQDLVVSSIDYPANTGPFSVLNAPKLPYTLPSGSTLTLSVKFTPTADGVYSDNVAFTSNGGSASLLLTGSAAGPPALKLDTQQLDGTYTSSLNVDFGSKPMGENVTLNVLVSNVGKSNLLITKCKPPYAGAIQALYNAIFEQELIAPGQTVTVPVTFTSPTVNPYVVGSPPQVFTAPWELNTNDPASTGAIEINFVARQTFPQVAGWVSYGCVLDAANGAGRTLSKQMQNPKRTVEDCLSACSAYSYAGLEYGGECWCGNSFLNTTSVDVPLAQCNDPCNGNKAEICGSGNRLTLYIAQSIIGPVTSTTTTPATSSISSATPPSTTSAPTSTSTTTTAATTTTTAVSVPSNWVAIGCLYDRGNPHPFGQRWGSGYTIAACLAKGASAGQSLCGLEYGSECWCDTQFKNTTSVQAPDSDCSTKCNAPGATGICGNGNRLSAYQYRAGAIGVPTSSSTTSAAAATSSDATSLTASSTATTSDATSISTSTTSTTTSTSSIATPTSGWSYLGCYSDPGNPRTFSKLYGSGHTTAACLAKGRAASPPMTFCGLEYGSECWCDTTWRNATVVDAPASKCSMACKVDGNGICGAGSTLSVYQYVVGASALTVSAPAPAVRRSRWA
ncbi:hypothetical protein HK101_010463 [Irineochytrium annulatum]|nr:hypothetical protein HK101_010463 [Irineochytrium annulatum]